MDFATFDHCEQGCRLGNLRRFNGVGLALVLIASGTACARDLPMVTEPAPEEVLIEVPVAAPTDQITLHGDRLPNVTLTADILYKILAAEIATTRGALIPAANTTLEVARDTTDPRLARRAVELYAAAGDLSGALQAAQVWQANAPNDEDAISTRLALSAAAGQTAGLTEALARQIRSSVDKVDALARAMGVLRRMQDRQQALRLMELTIEQAGVSGTLAAYMALADMAQAAGDYDWALEQAQRAMRLNPASEDAAMRVLDYGMAVDPVVAIEQASRFARSYPQARQLRLMLAGQLADSGDVQGALDELALMSAQFPEDFDLLFIRAQLSFQDGRFDDARGLLLEYVDVQSQREGAMAQGASDASAALTDAYGLLARIAQVQNEPDEAIAWLGRIQEPSARYPSRLRQAMILAEQDRVDEAIAIVDAANPIDQDEQLIGVLTLSQILRDAGRLDEAIDRLTKADQDIVDSVEIKYELGMLHERQKQHDLMERYMREVIELDPGYAHAYNVIGYSLADRNTRLQEAYELISRAHQILPQDPYILDSMGWVKFRQGDYDQAIDYLQRAFDLMPHAEVAAHLGEVLWVSGQYEQARDVWRLGLEIDSSNEVLVTTLKRFGLNP